MRRASRVFARAGATFCAVALSLAMAHSEAAGRVTHTVTIDGFAFHPPVLTVKQGDTVEWRNSDPVPHTVTATAPIATPRRRRAASPTSARCIRS